MMGTVLLSIVWVEGLSCIQLQQLLLVRARLTHGLHLMVEMCNREAVPGGLGGVIISFVYGAKEF